MAIGVGAAVGFLGTLIANFAAWLAQSMTKKVAVVTSVATITIALTGTMWAAMYSAGQALSVALPSEIGIAAGWFLPSNTSACFAALVSARAVRFAYDLRSKIIQHAVNA